MNESRVIWNNPSVRMPQGNEGIIIVRMDKGFEETGNIRVINAKFAQIIRCKGMVAWAEFNKY